MAHLITGRRFSGPEIGELSLVEWTDLTMEFNGTNGTTFVVGFLYNLGGVKFAQDPAPLKVGKHPRPMIAITHGITLGSSVARLMCVSWTQEFAIFRVERPAPGH
jgi:hypothetical protein